MDRSICIIGLSPHFSKHVAKKTADKLDMLFGDVTELLSYDLGNLEEAIKSSSMEYVSKLRSSKVKTLASYDKTMFTVDYSALVENNNYELIKNKVLVIYLKLKQALLEKELQDDNATPSQIKIANTLFENRDELCEQYCDVVLEADSLNVLKISNKLAKLIKRS